jgi:molybdopterin converting factor small subunit
LPFVIAERSNSKSELMATTDDDTVAKLTVELQQLKETYSRAGAGNSGIKAENNRIRAERDIL